VSTQTGAIRFGKDVFSTASRVRVRLLLQRRVVVLFVWVSFRVGGRAGGACIRSLAAAMQRVTVACVTVDCDCYSSLLMVATLSVEASTGSSKCTTTRAVAWIVRSGTRRRCVCVCVRACACTCTAIVLTRSLSCVRTQEDYIMCEDAVLSLACSADSEMLATGCRDGSISVRPCLYTRWWCLEL
jgi:hypothetical protein